MLKSLICALFAFFQIGQALADQVTVAPGPRLLLTTEEYPPMNYMGADGEIEGYATDLVREAAAKANIAIEIRLLPWKRAYHRALTEDGVCVYSAWRTPEREALFKWVGPLALDAWSFFAVEGSVPEISSLRETFDHQVGVVEGWGFTEHLKKEGHPNLDQVAKDDIHNLQKLMMGRIELWATGRLIARELLNKKHIANVREVFYLREVDLSMACNRGISDILVAVSRPPWIRSRQQRPWSRTRIH